MPTEAQKRAKQEYRKKTRQISIEFTPSDADILQHLLGQNNRSAYIKNLIKKDMGESN